MPEKKFVILAHLNGKHIKIVKEPFVYYPNREVAEEMLRLFDFDERVFQFEVVEIELEVKDVPPYKIMPQ